MKKLHRLSLLCAALLSFPLQAHAEEEEAAETPPARAVWIEPAQDIAMWVDMTPNSYVPAESEIIASNASSVLVREGAGARLVDSKFKTIAEIALPQDTAWITLKDNGQILVYDGKQLLMANDAEAAKTPQGFIPVLSISGAHSVGGAENTLVYADQTDMSVIDLAAGTMRKIPIVHFFDDEKIAEMTPEAIAEAEKKAKSRKKNKKKDTGEQVQNNQQMIADVLGIWWRHDGVGVIRVRSLLNIRTFITADNGRSWRLSADAPSEIRAEFGLIWDGKNRILSRDGSSWVASGVTSFSPLDRLLPSHTVVMAKKMPENWTRIQSPDSPVPPAPCEPGAECVMPAPVITAPIMIPSPVPSKIPEFVDSKEGLYAPAQPHTGMILGFNSDAGCINGADVCEPEYIRRPTAWMLKPDGTLETIDLPETCSPVYIGSDRGIGILLCDEGDPGKLTVYARSIHAPWTVETKIDAAIGENTRLLAADDGTLALLGNCVEETVPVNAETPDAPAPPPVTVCPVAVRQPQVIGLQNLKIQQAIEAQQALDAQQPHQIDDVPAEENEENTDAVPAAEQSVPPAPLWRIERITNAIGYMPVPGGRLISIEGISPASNAQNLILRTTTDTDTIAQNFDPAPYSGLVLTDEGCLALYDGRVSPDILRRPPAPAAEKAPAGGEDAAPQKAANDVLPPPDTPNVRLLSTEGRLAELTCADSRVIAETAASKVITVEEEKGDDRFGLRVGAGGFFTTDDVQTWYMRIEILIPIYNGRYEVSALYRMSGGNTSTAFGHAGLANIRWRYDELENFDFAVGAGLGYGSLCGYDKGADANANDDNDATKPSGYAKCSNYTVRFQISGLATFKFAERWKIFIGADLIGGNNWGFDLSGGIEVRF